MCQAVRLPPRIEGSTCLLLAASCALLVSACTQKGAAPPPEPRELPPAVILDYRNPSYATLRVDTVRDVVGGLSAAMAPALVDWRATDLESPEGRVVIYNVNHDGNPLSGTTVFRKVEYDLAGLQGVEFVTVPLGGGGKGTVAAHGQLRFLFSPDAPGRIVGRDARSAGQQDVLEDLVLSWEAWRAPGDPFTVFKGMDPASFRLTMRAYSGPQRFLEDALNRRDWFAYPMRLPGGPEGARELLAVALTIGDGVARRSLDQVLGQQDEEWVGRADRVAPGARGQWAELRGFVQGASAPDPAPADGVEVSYQTLLRSCATLALHSISVTTSRLLERRPDGAEQGFSVPPDPVSNEIPAWIQHDPSSSMAGLFVRAPYAVGFLVANPENLPNRIPPLLQKAGLLELADGKPVVHHYSATGTTPWGEAAHMLFR